MTFEIVRASVEHLDILAGLFDGYRQFYQQPSDVAEARVFLQARLANEESVILLALGEQGGMGFTQLYPTFSSVSMKRLWVLNDLFVASHARRLGVGEALLERARVFAAETGAKGLMLETAVDNLTAQRLYERLGWQRDTEFYVYTLSV